MSNEITFKIEERIGVIALTPTGWTKELNIISWNKNNPKYDIRDWSPDHERMSKGMTFKEEELKGLFELLKDKYESEDNDNE